MFKAVQLDMMTMRAYFRPWVKSLAFGNRIGVALCNMASWTNGRVVDATKTLQSLIELEKDDAIKNHRNTHHAFPGRELGLISQRRKVVAWVPWVSGGRMVQLGLCLRIDRTLFDYGLVDLRP